MEWGSISYSGQHRVLWYSTEKTDAEPSHLCLDPLYCFALPHQIILRSQHGMEGKANMILLCTYQYMVEYHTVWM